MVTLTDIAEYVGVSAMTVSRVINNSGKVSEKTRIRVQQAIRELSYHPNMVARGLATSKSRMVAYVVSNVANPYFAQVSRGIGDVCAEHGYSLISYDVMCEERLTQCLNMLIEHRLDGVIFHHLAMREQQIELLNRNNIRCVLIDNETEMANIPSIECDNYAGARMAVRHLVEKGHSRIGCIKGNYDTIQEMEGELEYAEGFQRRMWEDRTRGFMDEMKLHGLEPVIMVNGRASASTYSDLIMRKFSIVEEVRRENHATAFYCENDLLALSLLGECLENGIRVPDDVAIIGHDGLDVSMQLYPRITTVYQPKMTMGHEAGKMLLNAIEEKEYKKRIDLVSELFLGNTT